MWFRKSIVVGVGMRARTVVIEGVLRCESVGMLQVTNIAVVLESRNRF